MPSKKEQKDITEHVKVEPLTYFYKKLEEMV